MIGKHEGGAELGHELLGDVAVSLRRALTVFRTDAVIPLCPWRDAPCHLARKGDRPMDRERDRDVAEELIDDARKLTGGSEPVRRPGQGTDKPGGDESAEKPKD